MTPPSQIAHYRLTIKLGEGGMGAVYQATDTKLNREVAVKILPETFAADPDRLTRFTREAQVLASLNHPNIAAIYGVEDRALILELVPGETLHGPLPLDQALPLIRQLIDALEYAHEKGVVHRDLKPANLKITPDGRLKVLDFGLAKALSADSASADPMSSPTLTMRATLAGAIMGTAGYMSPEQARGHAVDKRADIWAFGAVVFEMLTGDQLFGGQTVSDSLAAVLTREPDVTRLPLALRTLVRQCLVKDARQRLRDIGDARLALDEPAPEAPSSAVTVRRGAPWWSLGVTAVLALVLAVFLWRATRPVELPLERLSVDLGPDAVASPRTTSVISPDGTRIAFTVRAANGRTALATRLLSQQEATILAGAENAVDPFFSPDGQWIAFYGRSGLEKISVEGGAAVTICYASGFGGAAWSTDGNIYFPLDSTHLYRVSAAGGDKPQPVVKLEGEHADHAHRWPQLLPGGDGLLVTAGQSPNRESDIEVLSLKTGQFQIVQRGGFFGRYLPSGHLIYIRHGTLFAVAFDAARLETRGMPVPILNDLSGAATTIAGTAGGGQLDFSRTGTLIYLSVSGNPGRQGTPPVWLDASGGKKPLGAAPPVQAIGPHLSPDGLRLAVTLNGDITVYDLQRDSASRLTFNGGNDSLWTPDGKHIVYQATGTGISWIRSDGSGQPQLLYPVKGGTAAPWSITPDGRHLAFHQSGETTNRDIWTLPLDLTDPDRPKAGPPELFLATPGVDVEPAFSPDGRWLAYTSNESGNYVVYVRPFPPSAHGGKWQISGNSGSRYPVWSRTAHELYYVSDNRIMVVPYTLSDDSFSPGPPRVWSETPVQTFGNFMPFDVSPDGKRFVAFPTPDSTARAANVHITFLLNFFDELKRKLP